VVTPACMRCCQCPRLVHRMQLKEPSLRLRCVPLIGVGTVVFGIAWSAVPCGGPEFPIVEGARCGHRLAVLVLGDRQTLAANNLWRESMNSLFCSEQFDSNLGAGGLPAAHDQGFAAEEHDSITTARVGERRQERLQMSADSDKGTVVHRRRRPQRHAFRKE